MRVLSVNCGSSTLKFRLFEIDPAAIGSPSETRALAGGIVDRIGHGSSVEFTSNDGRRLTKEEDIPDHAAAIRAAISWVRSVAESAIDAVGHRIVHGGTAFTEPVRLDGAVIAELDKLSELAPLHNVPALSAIRAATEQLGPSVPMVATFDTAFHAGMPARAARYAIPDELERHAVRRYGFHGLAHRYMFERYCQIASRPAEDVRLVTLQLGNGCSATAIDGGHSVDTSMGLTPLEGLVMGTRSGDVDPAAVAHLSRTMEVSAADVVELLNTQSGLLGLSGRTADMRDLLAAEAAGDQRAALAIEMFCYRTKKYLGAYVAALGGAEAVVFGGGIGENAPDVRARICAGMEWCGLRLDAGRNDAAVATEATISASDAAIAAYVIPVDEESIIARDTVRCLSG